MRLHTRLSASHTLPVLLVTAALALLLAALVKVSVVLGTLSETELETLRDEGALHRAIWGLDVAMRRAHDDCSRGTQSEEPRARIAERTAAVEETLLTAPDAAVFAPLAAAYLALGRELRKAPALCATLLSEVTERQREALDEQVTDLWVSRLQILHAAVSRKEEEARRIGVTAAWLGLSLALVSLVLALVVARRLARSLSQPLTSLADIARRVGHGDFHTPVHVDGPLEIRELAIDLERMREQLAQLDALKQGFLASVSHELRTPLSKIREALALLGDGVVGAMDPRQLRVLSIARSACEREIRMVATLLDLSRLRSGSPVRLRDGSSIDAIVLSAVADEMPDAEQRGVTIRTTFDGGDAPPRPLDPILLERAIANLVRNAVAVSRRGQTVQVRRLLTHGGDGSPAVSIQVEDEGPGVPEQIRKMIFEPFVTQAVPQSGKALGVGLGLALAREVARAHGGDLTLDERADRGARFVLRLPPLRSRERPDPGRDAGDRLPDIPARDQPSGTGASLTQPVGSQEPPLTGGASHAA